ncbi:hypothetical protein BFU36_09600 [Sulfolobus sp. A20]|uniref:hypothetical protein n=1 Tax=Sulfolobaceae TaxID=118883 RepID=UPI000845EA37|nr:MULTISPECIES: hypothetical protein [unclassified Sulfolobus]TRM73689.1 hypothetical protein DJ532_14520 [Sulfolobus sp. A20-N-F8]TRM78238.1 hypothetical protein DJ528_05075 [Sulfolobus sp. B5]TRM91453.1 hypothetical protein DJ526_06815 [Sulfolobus sp. A20-N-G8]AOL16919.1 hypothetical protein BFU36_09600 [Sulfolobus sp. A20]TRM96084.1 hypothetical protein DMP16_07845 [Sulfolobus sp. B1]
MTSPLSPGDFLLYNETVRSVLPNGSISIIKFILSQQIVSVYSNGTALVNFTIYVLNGSYYYAPSLSVQNSSIPATFFYISPNLLGHNVTRANSPFYFNGTYNDLYEYYSVSYVQGVELLFKMWFNNYGIAVKAESLQISPSNIVVSNATYLLWLTNVVNHSVARPYLSGFSLAQSTLKYSFLNSVIRVVPKIFEILVVVVFVLLIILLLIRPSSKSLKT